MPFRVPRNIAHRVCAGATLGFDCDEDDTVVAGFDTAWGGRAPYPPPGYLPWNRLEVGNGDTYGFYWPIGREADPPLVCTLMHDAAELYPLASSLESAVHLHIAAGMQCEEWQEIADDFAIDTADCEPLELEIDDEARGGIAPYWGAARAEALLPLDPHSPSLLLRRSRELSRGRDGDLESAQRALLTALEALPEYTAAWWELAQLRRRRSATAPQLADAIINSITSPLAFGHCDRRQALRWLQSIADPGEDQRHDPIWQRRQHFTFAQGVHDHGDFELYDQAIEEYFALGMSNRAVRLRVLCGELMARETLSFHQRKNFTWQRYWTVLREDLHRAGLHARLDALPS